jgi:hypothetical protein
MFLVEEWVIFTLIRDTRPAQYRIWSLLAGIALNLLVLGAAIVTGEVSSVRRSSDRLLAELRRGLSTYRLVLLMPAAAPAAAPQAGKALQARKSPRRAAPAPKPLAVPNPRLLTHMDAELADFIRENPAIESIVTRELVRDIDTKTLDWHKLLRKSSIRISLDIDEKGQIVKRRIEKSSAVPSIDHLSLELIPLLEKYQILWVMKGVRRVVVEIRIEDQIIVSLEGELHDPEQLQEVRRRVHGALAFLRLALGKDDAAFILDNAILSSRENQLVLSTAFEKNSLIDYLMRFYEPEPAK